MDVPRPEAFESGVAARLTSLLESHGQALASSWPDPATEAGAASHRAGLSLLGEPLSLAVLRDLTAHAGRREREAELRRTLVAWLESGMGTRDARAHLAAARDFLGPALKALADLADDDPVLPILDELLAAAPDLLREQEAAVLRGRCRALESEVRAIYRNVSDALLVVEPGTGRILECSPACRAVTGYAAAQLSHLSLADLCPDLTDELVREFTTRVVTDGEAALGDVRLVRRDGLELMTPLVGVLVRRASARVVLCVLRDPGGVASGLMGLEEQALNLQSAIARQLGEIERLGTFLERIISALPLRLLVLDQSLNVVHVNPAFYVQRGLAREDVVNHPIADAMPSDLLEEAGLRAAILSVLETGERVRWSGWREHLPDRGERVLNIRLDPCEGPDADPMVLLTMEDITERHYQLYERTVLQQISRAILGELELPKLLHVILTGMTAGGAVGLGFNRATLLLRDEEAGVLRLRTAVGPETIEEAISIWQEVSEHHRTLEDFLADYHPAEAEPDQPQRPLARLVFPLSDEAHLPMAAVAARQTIHVIDAELDPRVTPELHEALGSDEFVVAPLVARDKVIGAAIADNLFSQQPITPAAIQLLTALADQAALAIDTAETYQSARRDAESLDHAIQELKEAHDTLLQSAQLAAIGEVTAIVAHEIRSPLSTIGGFARSIAREPELVERSARNARIIVEEVVRLEGILGELLNFTRPPDPHPSPTELVEVLESVAERVRGADAARGVDIRVAIRAQVPLVMADEQQIRQVLTNLAMNSLQAMPDGGVLELGLDHEGSSVLITVQDSGEGIQADRLARIFDAFYTTKPTGTGLGLALCKKLVTQHGGRITVSSEEGSGTTVVVSLPAAQPDPTVEGQAEG